ncbi:hypothetical protein BCL80_11548 [Streptomyces avidinii]|nr:hypothetical protein BCL80_11548 [Streptomyces avidinii]SNX80853.1 hypothetical protein SAMN05421860_11348 [Streptomyces microflavus]
MTDVTAFLSPQESAGGVWRLWVDTTLIKGAGGVQHDFSAATHWRKRSKRPRGRAATGGS